MSAHPIYLAAPDLPQEPELVAHLTRSGAPVTVVRRCVDAVDLLGATASGGASTAVVGAGLPRLSRDTISRLRDSGICVVGLVAVGDDVGERRLRALDVPVIGVPVDDMDVVVRALADVRSMTPVGTPRPDGPDVPAMGSADTAGASGVIVTVWGPTGAPGRTSVALTVADESARSGTPALLVDADTQGGAVATHLALLDDVSGIVVACRQADAGTLDGRALAAAARTVHGSMRVITGIPRASRWAELRPAALTRVWEVCRATPGITVVDAGFGLEADEEMLHDTRMPRRNAATLTALAAADVVVAVGTADPVGMERLLLGLEDVRRLVPEVPVHVVVTRVRRSVLGRDPEGQVREALRQHAPASRVTCVPDDRNAFDACLRDGRTLAEAAPRSPARGALRDVAARISDLAAPARPRQALSA